jgi:hypothetical protein
VPLTLIVLISSFDARIIYLTDDTSYGSGDVNDIIVHHDSDLTGEVTFGHNAMSKGSYSEVFLGEWKGSKVSLSR